MSLKVYKKVESIIFIAFCILNITPKAFGICRLHISEDISLRPNLFITVGTQKINLILDKNQNVISIFKNQKIEAHCDTKFESPSTSKNMIKMLCNENNDLEWEHGYFNYNYGGIVQCSPQKWNLYETLQNFVWCPSNTTSYLLARPIDVETTKYQYLGGICYDTQHLSFKSLYYTLTPKNSHHLHPSALSDSYAPSLELEYLKETFTYKSVIKTDYGHEDVQNWLNFTQYNYSSIIQNTLVLNEFSSDQLGSILDLAWWPSLRLGNWKRYEEALTRQVESQHESYNIMAGVSAVAAVPIIEKCQTNYTLKELVDYKYNEIPMYIWNYLSSTKNSSDEIVVIAVNSPFYEFYEEQDVIFCPDKCQKISWLKKVSSTFRFSPLGIIFCCSSEDVKTSKRLDGFPDVDINGKQQGTATMKPSI